MPFAARASCWRVAALGALRARVQARTVKKASTRGRYNTGTSDVGQPGVWDRLACHGRRRPGERRRPASRAWQNTASRRDRRATRQAAGDAFEYRFLDLVAVKGRAEPVRVYELLGRAGDVPPERRELLARYDRGVALYHARQWEEAMALFDELAAAAPDDGPVGLYRRRAQELLEEPPGSDWDGVWIAQTK